MKLLITAFGLAILAYACQNEFGLAQQQGKKNSGFSTEERNRIVLPENGLITKNNAMLKSCCEVEMKKAEEMALSSNQTQSMSDEVFPAVDFLFVSIMMVN